MICAYAEWFYGEVEEASTNPELNNVKQLEVQQLSISVILFQKTRGLSQTADVIGKKAKITESFSALST